MLSLEFLVVVVVACPLAAAILTPLLGPRWLRSHSHLPAVVGIAAACAASIALLWGLASQLEDGAAVGGQFGSVSIPSLGFERTVTLWRWVAIDGAYEIGGRSPEAEPVIRNFEIGVTLRIDPLTALMLVVVTLISLLVAVYSIGYMAGDPGYWRFFTYISLFVFSMTMLVSVSNFLLLYVFWEAVGLCSYLLIGFWYPKPEAAAAGKKAFLVNRVGDFGFALGVFLLWIAYGTLNMHDEGSVPGIFGQMRLAAGSEAFIGGNIGLAICLLLFLGACGKSAQFPLHVWLPDAMEGPTPVSALIHAATMVTAGVYLLARCAPLYAACPESQMIVAAIGCFTALMAAFVALTQTDLKRILAYSTISQLGYMFVAMGVGGVVGIAAGMFHLFTHAFFKALLFLSAGSVMHALGGIIDLREFGGLRRKLPWTYVTFLVGAAALAGIFPLAGFWSKDAILVGLEKQFAYSGIALYGAIFWIMLVTAGLTAFYSFRAFFLAFHGVERLPAAGHGGHHGEQGSAGEVHESPAVMLGPLVLLAIGSVVAGLPAVVSDGFQGWLAQTPSIFHVSQEVAGAESPSAEVAHASEGGSGVSAHSEAHGHEAHLQIALASSAAALLGVAVAAIFYLPRGERLRVKASELTKKLGVYDLSYRKLYFDELYDAIIVQPLKQFALLCFLFDRLVIDKLVDWCGQVPVAIGAVVRPVQNGAIAAYVLVMILAIVLLLGGWLL